MDLAQTPAGVHVPPELPQELARLNAVTSGRLVLLSGREVSDLERFLPGYDGDMIGAHGAQTRLAGVQQAHPLSGSQVVARFGQKTLAFAEREPGLLVEQKTTGVVLHFRRVPDWEATATAFMTELAAEHPAFEAHPAKMAIELKLADVNKGAALEQHMAQLGPDVRPIMCGDDTTDETAMEVVNRMGGLSIKLGAGDTVAAVRMADPAALRAALMDWAGRAV